MQGLDQGMQGRRGVGQAVCPAGTPSLRQADLHQQGGAGIQPQVPSKDQRRRLRHAPRSLTNPPPGTWAHQEPATQEMPELVPSSAFSKGGRPL